MSVTIRRIHGSHAPRRLDASLASSFGLRRTDSASLVWLSVVTDYQLSNLEQFFNLEVFRAPRTGLSLACVNLSAKTFRLRWRQSPHHKCCRRRSATRESAPLKGCSRRGSATEVKRTS